MALEGGCAHSERWDTLSCAVVWLRLLPYGFSLLFFLLAALCPPAPIPQTGPGSEVIRLTSNVRRVTGRPSLGSADVRPLRRSAPRGPPSWSVFWTETLACPKGRGSRGERAPVTGCGRARLPALGLRPSSGLSHHFGH